jgi:hypothetical protein
MSFAVEGDPNHTSTRLRLAAVRALNEIGRPVTAHEVEQWLTSNDPDLWAEVSEKCYDYVRMILSLTRNSAIVKYRSREIRQGVDRRVAFYGLPSANYDDGWIQVSGSKRKGRYQNKKKRSTSKSSAARDAPVPTQITPQAHLLAISDAQSTDNGTHTPDTADTEENSGDESPDFGIIPANVDQIDDQAALDAWRGLSAEFSLETPLWSQLLSAVAEAKEFAQEGRSTREILQSIITKYSTLRESRVIDDAIMILCREVRICREMMACGEIR